MKISITKLDGKHHFYSYSRAADKAIQDALWRVNEIKNGVPEKTERRLRKYLEADISTVLGFRIAGHLAEARPREIAETLEHEARKMERLRAAHYGLFRKAVKITQMRLRDWVSYAEKERRIDALHYVLKKAFWQASPPLNGDTEALARALIGTGNLKRVQQRKRFCRLVSRIQETGKANSHLRRLLEGHLNFEGLLPPAARVLYLYPLAGAIRSRFKDLSAGSTLHSSVARYIPRLYAYRCGRIGIPRWILVCLEDIVGTPVRIWAWNTMRSNFIVNPRREIGPKTLGKLYGMLTLGHGTVIPRKRQSGRDRLYYRCSRDEEDRLLDALEQVGRLQSRVSCSVRTSRELARAFGKRPPSRARVHALYNIPFQYYDLVTHLGLREAKDPQFAREALRAWIEERGFSDHMRRGVYVSLRSKHEPMIRDMASCVGLSVSKGYFPQSCRTANLRIVYLANPGVVRIDAHRLMRNRHC